MKLFSDELIARACKACHVQDIGHATIGETILVSKFLQKETGIEMVRMDQGSPSLPINRIGVRAEQDALEMGFGSSYPHAQGIPELCNAASRFVKAFINIDIKPDGCIATTGSVAASFGSFIACTQRIPGKDKVLFIDPGFPIQKSQLRVLGIGWESFDIYNYRGAKKLKAKLEEYFKRGDIAAIIYSNPNNPAWICLEEEELAVIGKLATKYDVVVLEDLAYFCMDFRKDFAQPYKAPFIPTAAKYTDNYILMLSASKIFSYAGQRIALCCVSDKLYARQYPSLDSRYHDTGTFGVSLTSSILYMITSGCTTSTQYGYAAMLNAACDGNNNFREDVIEYARRAKWMKEIFCKNGFHIVYDRDVTQEVGDGFFFSLGYGNMGSEELVRELISYGISSISLSTTGSEQNGIRACSAMITQDMYRLLEERTEQFDIDHRDAR